MLSLLVAWTESKKGYYCLIKTDSFSCPGDYNENRIKWEFSNNFDFEADENDELHIQIAGSDISEKLSLDTKKFKKNTIFEGDGHLLLSGNVEKDFSITFDSQYVTFDKELNLQEGVRINSNKATLEIPLEKIDILSVTADSENATIKFKSTHPLSVRISENNLKLNDMDIRLQLGKTFGVIVSDETKIIYSGDKNVSLGKELIDIIVFEANVNVIIDESFENFKLEYKDEKEMAIIDYQYNGILTTKNKALPKIFQTKGTFKHKYLNNDGEYCIFDQNETVCDDNWNHIKLEQTEATQYKVDADGKISLYFAITNTENVAKFANGAFKDAVLELSADTTAAKCELFVISERPKSIISSVVSITIKNPPEEQLEFNELILKDNSILTINSEIPIALRAETLRVIGGSDIILPEGKEFSITSSNFEISLKLLNKISSSVANCNLHVDISPEDKFYFLGLGGEKIILKFEENTLEMNSTSYKAMTLHATNTNMVIGFNQIHAMIKNLPSLVLTADHYSQIDFDESWKDVNAASDIKAKITSQVPLLVSGFKQEIFEYPTDTVYYQTKTEKLCIYNADIDRPNCHPEYTKLKYTGTEIENDFGEKGSVYLYGFSKENVIDIKAKVTKEFELVGCGNSVHLKNDLPKLDFVKFTDASVSFIDVLEVSKVELDGKASFAFADGVSPKVESVYIDFNSISGVPLQQIKPKLFVGIEDHGPYRANCGVNSVSLLDDSGNVVSTIDSDSVQELTITTTDRVYMKKTFVYSVESDEVKLIPNFIQETNDPIVIEFDSSFDVDAIKTPKTFTMDLKHATIRSQYDSLPNAILEIRGDHNIEYDYRGVHCLYSDADTECPKDSKKTKFANNAEIDNLEKKRNGRIDLHIVGSSSTNMPAVKADSIKVIGKEQKVFIKLSAKEMKLLDATNAGVYLSKENEIKVAKLRRTELVKADEEPEVKVFYGDLESASSLSKAVGDEDEETEYHLDASLIDSIKVDSKSVEVKAGEVSAKFAWKAVKSMNIAVKASKEGKTKISFDGSNGKKIPKQLTLVAAAPTNAEERVKFVISDTFAGVESSAPIKIDGPSFELYGPEGLPQGVFDYGGAELKPLEPEPQSESESEEKSESESEEVSESKPEGETKSDEASSESEKDSSTGAGQSDGDTDGGFSVNLAIAVLNALIIIIAVCALVVHCKRKRNGGNTQANLDDKFVAEELDDMEAPLNRDEIVIDV